MGIRKKTKDITIREAVDKAIPFLEELPKIKNLMRGLIGEQKKSNGFAGNGKDEAIPVDVPTVPPPTSRFCLSNRKWGLKAEKKGRHYAITGNGSQMFMVKGQPEAECVIYTMAYGLERGKGFITMRNMVRGLFDIEAFPTNKSIGTQGGTP